MPFSTEQHLAVAKLIRQKAGNRRGSTATRFLKMSNSFVVCARVAAKERGGLLLTGFEWTSLSPDWGAIEQQIARLDPLCIASPPLVPYDQSPF